IQDFKIKCHGEDASANHDIADAIILELKNLFQYNTQDIYNMNEMEIGKFVYTSLISLENTNEKYESDTLGLYMSFNIQQEFNELLNYHE
ncbi:19772_t:CDS:2, partial [Racocetra persica]